jgi:toxin CcdB
MGVLGVKMARFDVYANPDPDDAEFIPYFLDVQNDHIQGFKTRVLVPLWRADILPSKFIDLNPEFQVKGMQVIMDTPALGAVAISALKSPIANLSNQQLVIQNALDTLYGGY